jgi:uncharacterized membrane protein YphA (DoxX/SURF4 family)
MPVEADLTWESRASKAVVLIRVLVGWVFLSEGIQKLFTSILYAATSNNICVSSPPLVHCRRATGFDIPTAPPRCSLLWNWRKGR